MHCLRVPMNVCTKFCANLWVNVDILLHNWKPWPAGGTSWKRTTKSIGFILRAPWLSVPISQQSCQNISLKAKNVNLLVTLEEKSGVHQMSRIYPLECQCKISFKIPFQCGGLTDKPTNQHRRPYSQKNNKTHRHKLQVYERMQTQAFEMKVRCVAWLLSTFL